MTDDIRALLVELAGLLTDLSKHLAPTAPADLASRVETIAQAIQAVIDDESQMRL